MSINATESLHADIIELYQHVKNIPECDALKIKDYRLSDKPFEGQLTVEIDVDVLKDGRIIMEYTEIFAIPAEVVAKYKDPRKFLYPLMEITVMGINTKKGTINRVFKKIEDRRWKEGMKRYTENFDLVLKAKLENELL